MWFEHFKEQLQGLTESFQQSGSKLSLLAFALKKNHLTSEAYLVWAMAQYQLPRLQTRFFTETPPSQEMFAKWATHYPWSVECLPVAEWDGALIIACLQPPQDFPSNPRSILVLADLPSLESYWEHLHPKKKTTSTATSPAKPVSLGSAPEGIDLSLATATTPLSTPEAFSVESLGIENSSVSQVSQGSGEISEDGELSEKSHVSTLDGLILDAKPVVLQKTSTAETENKLADKTEEVPALTPLVATEPITAPISAANRPPPSPVVASEIPATAPAPAVAQKKTSPPPRTGTPPSPAPVNTIKPVAKAATAAAPPPPPPENTPLPESFEESFGNKAIPLTPRPVGVARPTINPVPSGHFLLERIKKKNGSLVAEKIKHVLSEMKVYFEKSLVLTLDEEESQITVFAWDESFQDIKDTSLRLPLKTPSIFNIVTATQKPFHGYISLNEINESFFEEWNDGQIPDHVTITPLIIEEKIIGMLMGFGEKSSYNKVSLNLAEKLSTEFVKDLHLAS
ncbi:MAG: hypothetical protein AAGB31_01315 [Bdellovibrio sp.]